MYVERLIMPFMLISLLGMQVMFMPHALADECDAFGSAELWWEDNAALIGFDLAVAQCPQEHLETRIGLSYYADHEFLYEGLTGSFRFQAGKDISAYFGLGMLAGIGEKDVKADDDGVDNNDDGYVDELNEEKTIHNASIFAYPEVGLEIFVNDVGVVMSAKKYYGFGFDGNIIYSVGVALRM